MNEPVWLHLEAVLMMHEDSISLFGGSAGIRDSGLLESALARPQNIWAYEGPVDLPRLAAAYANGIIRNHPFVDGNKRTGFLAAYSFLRVNGLVLSATEVDATLQTLGLTTSEISEEAYADWIARHTTMPD